MRKKNKKAFEMAISTLVILVIAVVLLATLLLAFTGGFGKFWNSIKEFFISDIDIVKNACISACDGKLANDFCCKQRQIDFGNGKENVTCADEKLKIQCEINCEGICWN